MIADMPELITPLLIKKRLSIFCLIAASCWIRDNEINDCQQHRCGQ